MSFTIQEVPKEDQNNLLIEFKDPSVVFSDIALITNYLGFIASPPEHHDDYELIPDESAGYHYIQDFFSINSQQYPESLSLNQELRENIFAILKLLSDKEKEIIIKRYSLNDEEFTVEELAESFETTPAKIKELHTKAINKLRLHFENYNLYVDKEI